MTGNLPVEKNEQLRLLEITTKIVENAGAHHPQVVNAAGTLQLILLANFAGLSVQPNPVLSE